MTQAAKGVFLPSPQDKNPVKMVSALRQLAAGATNATGSFTLNSNATTTTVSSAPIIGPNSKLSWQPLTADAAAQMATLYCPTTDISTGQFILHHGSNTSTDQNFVYVVHS